LTIASLFRFFHRASGIALFSARLIDAAGRAAYLFKQLTAIFALCAWRIPVAAREQISLRGKRRFSQQTQSGHT